MWNHYKRTLIPMQVVIFGICAFLYFRRRTTEGGTILVFFGMQLASVLGAWWAARIRRQIEAGSSDRLPLE